MIRLTIALAAVWLVLLLALTCTDTPPNPFAPENARVSLLLKSSNYHESDTAITDTVGKTVRIGICRYLAQHIDSTVLSISKSATVIDTVIVCVNNDRQIDTVYYDITFQSTGNRTVAATAYVGANLRPSARATIHILPRPLPIQPPVIIITGNRSIAAGDTCRLTVTATDPDSGQSVSIEASGMSSSATFSEQTFSWATTISDTGTDTVTFIARDNGTPISSDTEVVIITVTPPGINRAPQFSTDTVFLTGHPGNQITLDLSGRCSDPDSDAVAYTLMSGDPAGDTISSTVYSFTPATSDTGVYSPHVIARDPKGASDTLAIMLTVTVSDFTPPILHLLSPASDSATAGSSDYQVRVSCKDPSGVMSVKCSMASDTFSVTNSDTLYSVTVTGLVANQWNAIRLIATDSSAQANQCTLFVHIRYDNDHTPPLLRLNTPANDSTSVNASSVTVRAIATDASGIALVTCNLGSTSFTVSKSSDSVYSATVAGLVQDQFNRIVFIARDSSLAANQCTLSVSIKYDPTMDDLTGPTIVQTNGPVSGATITDSIITITDSILDPSGIDSAYWTLNGARAGNMSLVAGSTTNYSLLDTLTHYRSNRIVVHAVDRSTRRNRDSSIILVDYNVPPQWLHRTISQTINEAQTVSLTLTDSCSNPDNDPLTFSMLTGKGAINQAVWSWTPGYSDSGSYIITIRVTDNVYADTLTMNLQVVNVNRAPVWKTKNLSVSVNEALTISLSLADSCLDPDNDPLNFTLLPGTPANDSITAQRKYSFTPTYNDSGSYAVKIVASDPALSDTMTVNLRVVDVPLYTLTTASSAGGSISITPSSPAINGNQYTGGTTITLTANPTSEYVFRKWSGDASGENTTVQVTMTKNLSIDASFILKQESFNPNVGGFILTPAPNHIFLAGNSNYSTVTRFNADNLRDTFNIEVPGYLHYGGVYSDQTNQFYAANDIDRKIIYSFSADSSKTYKSSEISASTAINWGSTKMCTSGDYLYLCVSFSAAGGSQHDIIQIKIPEMTFVREIQIDNLAPGAIVSGTAEIFIAGKDDIGFPTVVAYDKVDLHKVNSARISYSDSAYVTAMVLFGGKLWINTRDNSEQTIIFHSNEDLITFKELLPTGNDIFDRNLSVANGFLWCGSYQINITTLSYKSYPIFTSTPVYAGRRYFWYENGVNAIDKSLIQ